MCVYIIIYISIHAKGYMQRVKSHEIPLASLTHWRRESARSSRPAAWGTAGLGWAVQWLQGRIFLWGSLHKCT